MRPFLNRHLLSFLILLLCCRLTMRAQEQEPQTDRLGIQAGFGPLANQDLLASPFVYHSGLWPLAVHYDHEGPTNRHAASVWFRGTTLESVISGKLGGQSHTTEFVSLGAFYGYAHRIAGLLDDRLPVYAGGAWSTNFTIRNYDYGPSVPDETIAEVSSSFSARVEGEYALSNRGRIVLSLDGSLLSFTYRNPYGLNTDRDGAEATHHSYLAAFLALGSWHWFNEFFAGDARLSYSYALSPAIEVTGVYSLNYQRYAFPRTSTTVLQTFSAGIFYKF